MRNTRSASKANPRELVVKTLASQKKTVVEEEECVLVEEVTAIASGSNKTGSPSSDSNAEHESDSAWSTEEEE